MVHSLQTIGHAHTCRISPLIRKSFHTYQRRRLWAVPSLLAQRPDTTHTLLIDMGDLRSSRRANSTPSTTNETGAVQPRWSVKGGRVSHIGTVTRLHGRVQLGPQVVIGGIITSVVIDDITTSTV